MYAAEFTLASWPVITPRWLRLPAPRLTSWPIIPRFESVMILGDEASGVVRGIGVFPPIDRRRQRQQRSGVRGVQRRSRRCSPTARKVPSLESRCTCSRGRDTR